MVDKTIMGHFLFYGDNVMQRFIELALEGRVISVNPELIGAISTAPDGDRCVLYLNGQNMIIHEPYGQVIDKLEYQDNSDIEDFYAILNIPREVPTEKCIAFSKRTIERLTLLADVLAEQVAAGVYAPPEIMAALKEHKKWQQGVL